jgi:hypothetical protein
MEPPAPTLGVDHPNRGATFRTPKLPPVAFAAAQSVHSFTTSRPGPRNRTAARLLACLSDAARNQAMCCPAGG